MTRLQITMVGSYAYLPSPMRWPTNTFLFPYNLNATSSSTALPNTQQNTVVPFYVPATTAVASIGIWLVTAQTAAAMRLALYADGPAMGTTFSGGALVADAGEIDLSTGTGTYKSAAMVTTLAPGVYWALAMNKAAAAGPTVERFSSSFPNIILSSGTSPTTLGSGLRGLAGTISYGAAPGTAPGGFAGDQTVTVPIPRLLSQ